jgi:hypothetical protein
MIENYKSGKMWKDVTVTYFTHPSRLDSNTVPAKGKSDTFVHMLKPLPPGDNPIAV